MKKMRQPFILLFAAFLPGSLLFLQSGIPNSAPQFDHIALHVRDLQKSSEFYAKVLRLEKVPEPFKDGRHIWFRTPVLSATSMRRPPTPLHCNRLVGNESRGGSNFGTP
jgi:catechol 2,3-dioxygenase-like lactoylglutathione lyase family enzyme